MACSCSNLGNCGCDDDILTLPTGAPGLPGAHGPTGPQGLQGIQGTPGTNGAVGPTTCVKFTSTFQGVPGGFVTAVSALSLQGAGMLRNVYRIDISGNITSSAVAEVNDFVWQLWKGDGTGGWVDAEISGNLTSVTVTNAGDIRVVVTTTDYYKIVIIG